MKARLVENLMNESLDREELGTILRLIGEAHDKIMEAQDEIDSLSYEYDDEIIESLQYDLDDLEASLSELDFMGSDDPVADAYEHYDIEEGTDDVEGTYTVYAYNDEDGDDLGETFEFDSEEEAIDKADEIVDEYARVEVIDPSGEKIY